MSNLVADDEEGDVTRTSSVISSCHRSTTGSNPNISGSVSNLHRMKTFLSAKHLDKVQISLISKQSIRNAIRGTGSESELSVPQKIRENLHPEDPGKILS